MDWPARVCDVQVSGLRMRSETDSLPKVKPCQGAFQLNTMTCTGAKRATSAENQTAHLQDASLSIPTATQYHQF